MSLILNFILFIAILSAFMWFVMPFVKFLLPYLSEGARAKLASDSEDGLLAKVSTFIFNLSLPLKVLLFFFIIVYAGTLMLLAVSGFSALLDSMGDDTGAFFASWLELFEEVLSY